MSQEAPATRPDAGEIAVALILGAIGVYVILEGRTYGLGTIVRIGPAYFPIALGTLLLVLSIGLVMEALRGRNRTVLPAFAPFLFVMAGLGAWGLLVEPFGLVPATFALVILAAFAHPPARPLRILAIAAALSGFGWLVFVRGLAIPLTAFGG